MGASEAIAAIEGRAASANAEAQRRMAAGPWSEPIEYWAERFARSGRLTVNFHPDRIARSGRRAAAGLANDGRYHSQWVTGLSAGSRSAMPGGERQRFEQEFFAGAYDETDPASGDHPVYGALDLLFDHHGGSPRFGSCFLVLGPSVRARTTLSVGDSHTAPPDVGTFRRPNAVLAGLLDQAIPGWLLDRPLGVEALRAALEGPSPTPATSRTLDGYIEAQIHGGVSLADDVTEVVLDPSFRGSPVEHDLAAAAERYGLELRWHPGSELHVDAVPDDFRGPTMPVLASEVAADDGMVDAAAIGVAASRVQAGEPSPLGDPPDHALQQLKYLWHTVVAYGADAIEVA